MVTDGTVAKRLRRLTACNIVQVGVRRPKHNVVVPAKAGTHTPRPIGIAMAPVVFALTAVVMGPGLRRDDEGAFAGTTTES
jgi:hypothetical protein